MQRKRVVLVLILFIGFATILKPSTTSITTTNPKFVASSSVSHENFTIISPSESITWHKDSPINLIIWTVTNNALNTVTFDIFRNGTFQYSGIAESISYLHGIPIFCSVPISELNYGTYNYTLIATDGVETKSAMIIVNIMEGISNTSNPLIDAMSFVVLIGGLTALSLAVLFGFTSLNRHLGGLRRIEP